MGVLRAPKVPQGKRNHLQCNFLQPFYIAQSRVEMNQLDMLFNFSPQDDANRYVDSIALNKGTQVLAPRQSVLTHVLARRRRS